MRKPNPDKAANNILRMVKQQCKANGVRFSITKRDPFNRGGFIPEDLLLELSSETYQLPKGRLKPTNRPDMAITALHELVHVWQWKRKDKNFKAKVDGKDCYTVLSDYSDGVAWSPKPVLKKCLTSLVPLEFEAEMVSLQLAKSMGLELDSYTKWIKEAKAYCYAWYVLVETGIWSEPYMSQKWMRHIKANLEWDLTRGLLAQLCKLAREDKEHAVVVWKGKKVFIRGVEVKEL